MTIASSGLFILTRLSGADPIPLVLNGVDLHSDAPTLLHSTMSTLIPFVFVDDTFSLKPKRKQNHCTIYFCRLKSQLRKSRNF